MGALLVIVGILLMVVVHEGAHFVAAKAFKMKATEAFFGFGPRLWSITRGETEYGVKAIPLGGYVRIIGMSPFEEVDPEDLHRTYRSNPFWKKSVVVLAGIGSHFVVAFLIFFFLAVGFGLDRETQTVRAVSPVLITGEDPLADRPVILLGDKLVSIDGVPVAGLSLTQSADKQAGEETAFVIDRNGELITHTTTLTVSATPAVLAGVQVGDRLVSVDGIPINEWADFVALAHERPGVETAIVVERAGQQLTLPTTLLSREIDGEATGFFGVSPTIAAERLGPISGIDQAGSDLWLVTEGSAEGLWALVTNIGNIVGAAFGQDDAILDEVRPVSVIGLTRFGGELGIADTLFLIAWVNVFVGMLNVVPLYPLDGGHFSVALYEKIRGKEPDVRKLLPVAAAVFIFILLLGLLGVYFDIVDPITIPE